MNGLMLAAPASSSGKTAVSCALLEALKRRGLRPCAFKCGPDYIDPMFHRAVLGVESHNLDLFLAGEAAVRALYRRACAGHSAAVCEGAMGFYDGLGGVTDQASAWHVAAVLELPVILVVRPGGSSLTLAAQIKGLREFRPDSRIVGILLNDCQPGLYGMLAPMLQRETGLPVLGFLPHLEEARFESRHLGLYTAGEIEDLGRRVGRMADALEEHADLERLLALCEGKTPPPPRPLTPGRPCARIAVARDEAFCFYYEENLELLRRHGAELAFFSPLRDKALPAGTGGLYLGGGYPELHARRLSENEDLRRAVKAAVNAGMPTVAECGGFLYLGRSLRDPEGRSWPMSGVLPGDGADAGRLVRFGYARLTAKSDSLLLRRGETVPVHEFHHWDSTENGGDLAACKPLGGREWVCGFTSPSLYAAFPHLYFASDERMAARFVRAAGEYRYERSETIAGPDRPGR